jgi:hypothetical protein
MLTMQMKAARRASHETTGWFSGKFQKWARRFTFATPSRRKETVNIPFSTQILSVVGSSEM